MENLIKALQILLKYGNPEWPTHCEHDILYISSEIDPAKVSKADKEELAELGFFPGEEYDQGFISHKFGSC